MAGMQETTRRYTAGELVANMKQIEGWSGVELRSTLHFDKITLVSPPDEWPVVIRLDYRIDGQRGRHEAPWEGLERYDLEGATTLWFAPHVRRPWPAHAGPAR